MIEDELRERAINYLRQTIEKPVEKDEFTIKDICEEFNLTERQARVMMDGLVKQGLWETRIAYVSKYEHRMRLWRMKK